MKNLLKIHILIISLWLLFIVQVGAAIGSQSSIEPNKAGSDVGMPQGQKGKARSAMRQSLVFHSFLNEKGFLGEKE